MKTITLLEALTKIPVLSGFERNSHLQELLMELLSQYKPVIDSLGNVIVKISSGKKKIVIEAHMDEVGFIQTRNGFATIGSIAEEHIQKENIVVEEGSKLAYFKRRFEQEGGIVKSPALDNKVGCAALLLASEKLKDLDADLYLAFTVREETNKSGILRVMDDLRPETILSVDSAYAQPYHNKRWEVPECGKGPAIQIQGTNFTIPSYTLIEGVAKREKIPYQFEIVDSDHGGTNLSALSGRKVEKFQINIPVRYQHTALSEVSLSDIEHASSLIYEFAKELSRLQD